MFARAISELILVTFRKMVGDLRENVSKKYFQTRRRPRAVILLQRFTEALTEQNFDCCNEIVNFYVTKYFV